jgi:hypothetical protein
MKTPLDERQYDCAEAASRNSLVASDAIKNWLDEEHTFHPFILDGFLHRRLQAELKYFGFADITVSKLETHPVFVFKGKIGESGCRSQTHFEELIEQLTRGIGMKFRTADAALLFSRTRFQLVVCLPDDCSESPAHEPDACLD